MKLPNELYVRIEGTGDEQTIIAIPNPEGFAVVNESVTATLYRRVGTVKIKADLFISEPIKG